MKPSRVLLSMLIMVAILFASAFCARAIGFEAETAYESVFVIYSGNSLGSGFAIGENCIVTNAHVIENKRNIRIETYGGQAYQASVLGINQHEDIAVLVVENAKFPYLEIADLSTMKTGDDIYTIGAPKGMTYTLTKGGISAKEREVSGQTYIQIDAPINGGNSGGPLLNDDGRVLGMNTMKLTDSEGIGLAIPISRICEYLQKLGVVMDEKGNVSESIQITPEETEPKITIPMPGNQEETDRSARNAPAINLIAILVAVLSLIGNGILAVLLINEKKKCATLQYDPSERTDFEIEILE